MNSPWRTLFLVSAIGVLLATTAMADERGPLRTSVCRLANASKDMDGYRVRLTAIYVSDLQHTSVLKDRRCAKRSLAPFAADGSADPSVEEFDSALWGELSDREVRVFVVDVTGVYRWRDGDRPHGVLLIERVWSFRRWHGDWRNAR
jgi:hypothetical protein